MLAWRMAVEYGVDTKEDMRQQSTVSYSNIIKNKVKREHRRTSKDESSTTCAGVGFRTGAWWQRLFWRILWLVLTESRNTTTVWQSDYVNMLPLGDTCVDRVGDTCPERRRFDRGARHIDSNNMLPYGSPSTWPSTTRTDTSMTSNR